MAVNVLLWYVLPMLVVWSGIKMSSKYEPEDIYPVFFMLSFIPIVNVVCAALTVYGTFATFTVHKSKSLNSLKFYRWLTNQK